jgi:hypothetical protein
MSHSTPSSACKPAPTARRMRWRAATGAASCGSAPRTITACQVSAGRPPPGRLTCLAATFCPAPSLRLNARAVPEIAHDDRHLQEGC